MNRLKENSVNQLFDILIQGLSFIPLDQILVVEVFLNIIRFHIFYFINDKSARMIFSTLYINLIFFREYKFKFVW